MSLQDQIVAYFHLDQEQRALRTGLDAAERRLAACHRQAEQLATQKAELAGLAKQRQAQAKTLELITTSIQEKIDQLRARMTAASNNKEYQAMLIETQKLTEDKTEAENASIDFLGQSETASARLIEFSRKQEEQTRIIASAEQEVASAKTEIGDRLIQVLAKRDAIVLPPEVQKQYQYLANLYDGEAVAAFEPADRRKGEYVCAGCHITLPRQVLNALLNSTQHVCACTSCGRLLYLGIGVRESLENPEPKAGPKTGGKSATTKG